MNALLLLSSLFHQCTAYALSGIDYKLLPYIKQNENTFSKLKRDLINRIDRRWTAISPLITPESPMNALLLLSSLFHQCTAYASQNLPETHLLVIEEMPYWFSELFIYKPEKMEYGYPFSLS